jgi:hypothetical protein
MSARLARLALALYPLAYRRRYGEEMAALVEDTGATPRAAVDLARGALRAHLRPEPGIALDGRDRMRLAMSSILLCWIVFAAAILGFAKTIEQPDFAAAHSQHALLGGAHLAFQLFAILAGASLLLGAAPLVALALPQLRRRPGLRRALWAGIGCVAAAVLATAALVLIANYAAPASGTRIAIVAAWIAIGLGCALGCGIAARRGLFAARFPDEVLRLADVCAAIVAVAMVGIAAATGIYLVALLTEAPGLAGEANGPGGLVSVGVSLGACLAAMAVLATVGSISALRTRRVTAG